MPSSASQNQVQVPLIVAGNTPHTEPENRVFFPALDGLRAIAFLMVFGQHYLQLPWGWTGVDLFFVLSGFLITGILFDTRRADHRVRNFYVRRTLRIFPLYYGVMLLFLAVAPFAHWQWNWTWLLWPAYLGNLTRFLHPATLGDAYQRLGDFVLTLPESAGSLDLHMGHFWSLAVEEQFYLVWPWIVFLFPNRRKLIWICSITLPICLVLRVAGQHSLPAWMLDQEILYRLTPFRIDSLLTGALIALVVRGGSAPRALAWARKIFPFALGLILLWLLVTPGGKLWQRPYNYPGWKFTWGLTGIDVFAGLSILVAIQPDSLLYRWLSNSTLRWVGRISYGAYVFHDIPHILYMKLSHKLIVSAEPGLSAHTRLIQAQTLILTAGIAFAATLAIAWLSFRYFESPFLELKERWTLRGTSATITPALDAGD